MTKSPKDFSSSDSRFTPEARKNKMSAVIGLCFYVRRISQLIAQLNHSPFPKERNTFFLRDFSSFMIQSAWKLKAKLLTWTFVFLEGVIHQWEVEHNGSLWIIIIQKHITLFGLQKCSANINECQWVHFFFPHRGIWFHAFASYTLPLQMPVGQTIPLLPSVKQQQN